MKIAVVLFNLGGPDSLENVKPFLFNLFNDDKIITLPNPFRYLVAKLISSRRNKKAQGIYKQMGGASTILPETKAQAKSLQESLKNYGEYKVFIDMRYWHPMSAEVVKEIKEYAPERIIMLPLYPQFSTTTTESSFENFQNHLKAAEVKATLQKICCYPIDQLFIDAYVDLISSKLKVNDKEDLPIILYSAHGIPLNRIQNGDPYQHHVEKTVEKINSALKAKGYKFDFETCYQSKVGPLKWLEPATEDAIEKYSKEKRHVILAPISFVSEHSETLVELDIQYKELADLNGAKSYKRVPTVGTHVKFIECLKELVLNSACQNNGCSNRIADCKVRII